MADLSGAPELSLACPGPRLRSGTPLRGGGGGQGCRHYEGRNWFSSWREALSAMPPRAIGWPCIVPTAMSSGRTAVRMTRPEGVGSRYVCSSTPEV